MPLFTALVSAALALQSPFPSSVNGLSIPNAHEIASGPGQVIRGNAPLGDAGDFIAELKNIHVTDVLIFRDAGDGTPTPELEKLKSVGLRGARVKVIPFRWKQVGNFQGVCRQIVEGLAFLKNVRGHADRKAFFHCTVGEDRTGLLAGLFRMMDQGWVRDRAFQNELCARGYEAGNPKKPQFVSKTVRDELTPVFIKMSRLISDGKLARDKLSPEVCDQEPELDADLTQFVCQPQPV